MTTQSNPCTCAVCNGSECKCGCQTTARPAASCQCGPACACGDTCTCGTSARPIPAPASTSSVSA